MTRRVRSRSVALLCAASLLLSACAPSLSPLFRDYEVTESAPADTARIRTALQEAGWNVRSTPDLPVIRTEPRTIENWLLYKVRVQLDVAAVNDEHVRVFIHPRREYIFGARSKLMYLKESHRDEFVPALNRAFAQHGLELIGEPFDRRGGRF